MVKFYDANGNKMWADPVITNAQSLNIGDTLVGQGVDGENTLYRITEKPRVQYDTTSKGGIKYSSGQYNVKYENIETGRPGSSVFKMNDPVKAFNYENGTNRLGKFSKTGMTPLKLLGIGAGVAGAAYLAKKAYDIHKELKEQAKVERELNLARMKAENSKKKSEIIIPRDSSLPTSVGYTPLLTANQLQPMQQEQVIPQNSMTMMPSPSDKMTELVNKKRAEQGLAPIGLNASENFSAYKNTETWPKIHNQQRLLLNTPGTQSWEYANNPYNEGIKSDSDKAVPGNVNYGRDVGKPNRTTTKASIKRSIEILKNKSDIYK